MSRSSFQRTRTGNEYSLFHSNVGVEHCSTLPQLMVSGVGCPNSRKSAFSLPALSFDFVATSHMPFAGLWISRTSSLNLYYTLYLPFNPLPLLLQYPLHSTDPLQPIPALDRLLQPSTFTCSSNLPLMWQTPETLRATIAKEKQSGPIC